MKPHRSGAGYVANAPPQTGDVRQNESISNVKAIVTTTCAGHVCAVFLITASAFAMEFHVSPTGDDTMAGTARRLGTYK